MFRRAVERQRFHTFNTHIQGQEKRISVLNKCNTLWNWISIRSPHMAFMSSLMINSAICCTHEKKFPLTCYNKPLCYDKDITLGLKLR